MLQQADPTGLIHADPRRAAGSAPTPERPSPLAMPSFAWKLDDEEIADVATYVRNSWGNRAAPVTPDDVARLRREMDLSRPTP